MTLRTATYDDSKFKICPTEPTEKMISGALSGRILPQSCEILRKVRQRTKEDLASAIAAAPEYQGTEFLRRPIGKEELNDPEYIAAYIESMDEDFDECIKYQGELKSEIESLRKIKYGAEMLTKRIKTLTTRLANKNAEIKRLKNTMIDKLIGSIQVTNSAIAPDPRMNEPWTPKEKSDLNATLAKVLNWNQDTKKDE
jgi:chaperonin cofactor prefoldin